MGYKEEEKGKPWNIRNLRGDCLSRPSSIHPLYFKPSDRIPSTTPGAEPPRGAKDSGSARSHSTHLETSSQKRP